MIYIHYILYDTKIDSMSHDKTPTRQRNPLTAYLANKDKPAAPPPSRNPHVFTAYLAGKSKPVKAPPEPSSTISQPQAPSQPTDARNRTFRETRNLGTSVGDFIGRSATPIGSERTSRSAKRKKPIGQTKKNAKKPIGLADRRNEIKLIKPIG